MLTRLTPKTLRSRMLLMGTLPLGIMLAAMLWSGHRTTTQAVSTAVERGLVNDGQVLAERIENRLEGLISQGEVIAHDPRFFVNFSIPVEDRGSEFANTLEGISADFLGISKADFLEIHRPNGGRIARAGQGNWSEQGTADHSIQIAAQGINSTDAIVEEDQAILVADIPILVGGKLEAVLRLGLHIDESFVQDFRAISGAELAVFHEDRLILDSFPMGAGEFNPTESGQAEGQMKLGSSAPKIASLNECDHLILDLPLLGRSDDSGFVFRVGRDLESELAPLRAHTRQMAILGGLVFLASILALLWIAVGVSRSLERVVSAAQRLREGQLDDPVSVEGQGEVRQLAESFEEMRQSLSTYVANLQDVDKLKGDFLSLAAHELRTPLTSVLSFHELLKDGVLGDDPEEIQEMAEGIEGQMRGLVELVNDMLDLLALEQNPTAVLRPKPIGLHALAATVIENQAARRKQRKLSISWEQPESELQVQADEKYLGRAIKALLDNAVRFTPDGGKISISTRFEKGEAALTIEDSGVGIDSKQIHWLFDRFHGQGDILHHSSGDLEYGSRGMGLGLALTRAIIESHGGRMGVDSQVGRGSKFTLLIPAQEMLKDTEIPAELLEI